jgi:hypothetical protein
MIFKINMQEVVLNILVTSPSLRTRKITMRGLTKGKKIFKLLQRNEGICTRRVVVVHSY